MAGLEDLPTPALTAYPLPQQAISRAWLSRPALQVASGLLGALLAHDCADGTVVVRLTEVEAYEGTADPGSHAFRGPTPRTRVMFGPAGHLYVYFSYGMHWCTNVVCGPDGTASAVLLRAGEVVAGHELARQRRPAARVDRDLARGPARLAAALGIAKAQHGTDVCGDGPVRLLAGPPVPPDRVQSGPRVGVSGAGGDGAVHPWRFWLDGEPTVSTYRPATGRTRARRRG